MKHAVVYRELASWTPIHTVAPRPGRYPNAMAIKSTPFNTYIVLVEFNVCKNGTTLPTHPTPRTYVNPTIQKLRKLATYKPRVANVARESVCVCGVHGCLVGAYVLAMLLFTPSDARYARCDTFGSHTSLVCVTIVHIGVIAQEGCAVGNVEPNCV